MQTLERISDELERLRRGLRDLIAPSALPRVWIDMRPAEIAGDFADILQRSLRPNLVYVRLNGPADGITFEAACVNGRSDISRQLEEIRSALAPWLKAATLRSGTAIPNPAGSGSLRITVLPIGHAGEYGMVAVGSQQP